MPQSLVAFLLFTLTFANSAWSQDAASALRFRISADPLTLDWNLASSSHETYVLMNIMEGLVEEGPDLRPRPALAERWDVSADGKTYVFHLRPGVKWSDGKPLKASDFEDSWRRLLDPKLKAPYASSLFAIEGAEELHAGKLKNRAALGVKALGPLKLEVRLKYRVPHFLHLTTFWVTFPIRADLIKMFGPGWAMPGKIATLGPYLLTGWKKGALLQMKRNPSYFGSGAELTSAPEQVEILIEPNDARARQLFDSAQLDFFLNATTQDLLKARAAPGGRTRVEQYPYLATYYLGFRTNKGPLRERSVREAFATAVDRDSIPSILQGGQVAANSWFPPGLEGHGANTFPARTLHEARAALAKAGFPEGQRFPRLVLTMERFDGAEQLGRFLSKSFLERLGVTVDFRFPDRGESFKTVETDLFVAHWGADYPDAENFLGVFSRGNGNEYTRWKSEDYDRILERARSASDAGARLQAYAEAEKFLLQRETVIVPLFYSKNTVLLSDRVKRFSISPLNYLFFKAVEVR
ncbi:MAG: peptide ABC transporter substrate-binding protein [Oligoflexia bacterium]|nr:peptide ABC transporter substrate-binding protein [Oligoflexia bacterium]